MRSDKSRPVSRLEIERIIQGYSQTDLAEITGLRQRTISDIETGRLRPNKKELTLLAAALSVDADELMEPVQSLAKAEAS